DGRDLLEARSGARLPAPGAMARDRETVRLVAHLLDEMERRVVGRKAPWLLLSGDEELLEARFPLRALGDTDHRDVMQAQVRHHGARRVELADATVDEDQVGHLSFAVRELAVAHAERIAHGTVVVAGLDALHVITPVFGVLHRALVVHDAGSDGRLSHRVADVEALDALD